MKRVCARRSLSSRETTKRHAQLQRLTLSRLERWLPRSRRAKNRASMPRPAKRSRRQENGRKRQGRRCKAAHKTVGFGRSNPESYPLEPKRTGKKCPREGLVSPRVIDKPPRSPNKNQTGSYSPANPQSSRGSEDKTLDGDIQSAITTTGQHVSEVPKPVDE